MKHKNTKKTWNMFEYVLIHLSFYTHLISFQYIWNGIRLLCELRGGGVWISSPTNINYHLCFFGFFAKTIFLYLNNVLSCFLLSASLFVTYYTIRYIISTTRALQFFWIYCRHVDCLLWLRDNTHFREENQDIK